MVPMEPLQVVNLEEQIYYVFCFFLEGAHQRTPSKLISDSAECVLNEVQMKHVGYIKMKILEAL